MIMIDVRTASEYQSGHIANTSLHTWVSPTVSDWQSLPSGTDIVVICQSGNRAGAASVFLDTAGSNKFAGHVLRMTGGMTSWSAKYAVVALKETLARASGSFAAAHVQTNTYDLSGKVYHAHPTSRRTLLTFQNKKIIKH